MTWLPPKRAESTWVAAAGLLALHAAAIAVSGRYATSVSYFFLTAIALCTALAAFYRARLADGTTRRPWLLLTTAFVVWALGMGVGILEELVLKTPDDVGATSQIIFFLFGVPLLLALYCTLDSPHRFFFVSTDALQIALMSFLIYLVVFDNVPFSHVPMKPVSTEAIVHAFNVENLVLATAAVLRFFGARPGSEQREFYGALATYLWLNAAATGYYNTLTGNAGFADLLIDIPFLTMLAIALSPALPRLLRPPLFAPSIGLLLDNAMPALFPFGVIALGIAVAGRHFVSSAICMAAAFGIFGVRSTLVQLDYHKARTAANEARDSMRALAITDSLTGVYNRRHFDQQLEEEWNRASRQGNHFSLLMIDIDYFKFINDNFGHADGDVCLRQVASALQSCLQRRFDILARYGGEEFAAVLPQTDRAGAEIVARRMRLIVNDLKLRNRTPMGTTVTISIGAATRQPGEDGTPEQLVEAADRALYRAKRGGRNCTKFEPLHGGGASATAVTVDAVLV